MSNTSVITEMIKQLETELVKREVEHEMTLKTRDTELQKLKKELLERKTELAKLMIIGLKLANENEYMKGMLKDIEELSWKYNFKSKSEKKNDLPLECSIESYIWKCQEHKPDIKNTCECEKVRVFADDYMKSIEK